MPVARYAARVLEPVVLQCPYCGESFESSVDASAGDQAYTEDCAVCCQPILVSVRGAGTDGLDVSTRREQD